MGSALRLDLDHLLCQQLAPHSGRKILPSRSRKNSSANIVRVRVVCTGTHTTHTHRHRLINGTISADEKCSGDSLYFSTFLSPSWFTYIQVYDLFFLFSFSCPCNSRLAQILYCNDRFTDTHISTHAFAHTGQGTHSHRYVGIMKFDYIRAHSNTYLFG